MKPTSIKDTKMKIFSNQIVLASGLGIFFTLFFIFSTKILISKYNYQNNVIGVQKLALVNLNNDISASKTLDSSYSKFVSPTNNIIGGLTANPNSVNGGDNAKIILDALPSTYDFPEFITTLQNLLVSQGVSITSISGTDQSATLTNSPNGVISQIPFQVTVSGSYSQIENLINAFQRSIRPIDILKFDLTSNQNNLSLTISAQTYYQPGVQFTISKRLVN